MKKIFFASLLLIIIILVSLYFLRPQSKAPLQVLRPLSKASIQDYFYGKEAFKESKGEYLEFYLANQKIPTKFTFYKPNNINYSIVNKSNRFYELKPVIDRSEKLRYCGERYVWTSVSVIDFDKFDLNNPPLYLSFYNGIKPETVYYGQNKFDRYMFNADKYIYVMKETDYVTIVELLTKDCDKEVSLIKEFESLMSSLKIQKINSGN